MGYITPIYKKQDKPINDPNSYRRITITNLIGKLLEKIQLKADFKLVEETQNPLQKGFTAGCSPITAALLFTEAIAEAKDSKNPLFAAYIDASKAFDVVWHQSLLRRLFVTGLHGNQWLTLQDGYSQMSSVVNWEGKTSRPIVERQGVRQGGIISPVAYKAFLNPLLDLYRSNNIGLKIGPHYTGTPACADDILLLASTADDLQAMLEIQGSYANAERYTINENKTKVMIFNSILSPTDWNNLRIFHLNDKPIEVVDKCTHLGIQRDSESLSTHAETIHNRIQSARKCLYSLMGAGLHGMNGINPVVSISIFNTFVVPRLLYGLEALVLRTGDLKKLNQFHKHCLKSLMSLPDRTADPAIYILSGQLPAEAEVHKRTLTLLGSIARGSSTERDIAERQLLLKDKASKSWFIYAQNLLFKYNLPDGLSLFEEKPAKLTWKNQVRAQVENLWREEIACQAKEKSSLKLLSHDQFLKGRIHPLWENARHDPTSVRKAGIKAKIVTRTYILQVDRSKFNQYQVDPTCVLCNNNPEDLQHFLLECPTLEEKRRPFIVELNKVLEGCGDTKSTPDEAQKEILTGLLVDCHKQLNAYNMTPEILQKIEAISRGLIFSLHIGRTRALTAAAEQGDGCRGVA